MRKVIQTSVLLAIGLARAAWAAEAESLSQAQGSLFSAEKIYQLGDLVTVIIAENATAEQSASTELHKEFNLGLTTGGSLGTLLPSAGGGLNSKQTGGGNLQRQGKVMATITTRVVKILPNGCLGVAGQQEIELDSGRQRISVQGTVRPRDISSANEVVSCRLADAQIEFLGQGALHEKARTGFLSRVLEWLWIF